MRHGRQATSVAASIRLYRLLVRAYPRAFRDEFGKAMQATFRDAVHAAHERAGAGAVLAFWPRTFVDFVRSVMREHAGPASTFTGSPASTTGGQRRRRTIMGGIAQDTRYALRSLMRAPAFTAVAILTLGLGVGAVVAIFGVVDGVLLRPPPFADPDRIVRIYGSSTEDPGELANVSPLDMVDLREASRSMDAIAMSNSSFLSLTGSGEPVMVWVTATSAAMFDVLRVRPAFGRLYSPEEEENGRHQVVVLSHAFWQSRFGGDASIVGRSVTLQGAPFEIIGVLPAGFEDPAPGPFGEAQMWRPLSIDLTPEARGGHWLQAYGRLASGATVRSAETELLDIMSRLETEYAATNTGQTVRLRTLHESLSGQVRRPLGVLFGAVMFLLLIACANVANLMLARSAIRRRELAVRGALGAGRLRVARQLFLESAVVAGGAAATGIAIAWLALRMIPVFAPNLPRPESIRINGVVLVFAIGVSALTAILFGLAPIAQALRGDMQSTLRDGGRGTTTGLQGKRFRGALVVVEIALSMILLAGAGLLVRSFQRLVSVDAGFDRNVLTATVSLPRGTYSPERRLAFFRDMETRAQSLPGVSQAGLVNMLPMSGQWSCDSFAQADREPPPSGQEPCAETRTISPTYFDAFGIASVRGRTFDETDREGAPPVAIINRRLADEFWPGQDPVGKQVKWGWFGADTPWLTIVGVVGDVKHFGLDGEDRATIYMPLSQQSASRMTLIVRTAGEPSALAPGVRALVRGLDPDLPMTRLETMTQVVSRSVAEPRFQAVLLAIFAGIALFLSLTGLYGVLAFTVAQRTHEIGIRMAIGAARTNVLGMVVRQGLGFAAAGIAIGVPIALLSTRALRGLLFAIPPTDALTYTGVIALLVAVCVLASWLPAWRATRVDPLIALREN